MLLSKHVYTSVNNCLFLMFQNPSNYTFDLIKFNKYNGAKAAHVVKDYTNKAKTNKFLTFSER